MFVTDVKQDRVEQVEDLVVTLHDKQIYFPRKTEN